MKKPYVVSYGMGVDSTAMLVGLHQRGIRPDLILFADTVSERDETYEYLPIMNKWLEQVGFPKVTVIEYQVKNFKNWPHYRGLEENCLTNGTLPSEAFGFGSCSIKWKQAPQDKYVLHWDLAQAAIAAGVKIVRAIGYDASPADKKRSCAAGAMRINTHDSRFEHVYPLQEWGWDRERCIQEIKNAGLPVPSKSSCFFCPNMRPHEVDSLSKEKLGRIVVMEARAKPRLLKIEGLWRNGCKGTRGGEKKPGTMTQYIRERGLLPGDLIDWLIASIPTELIQRNHAHAQGETVDTWTEFFKKLSKRSTHRK